MADRYSFTKFDSNTTHDKILEKIVYKYGPAGPQGDIGNKGDKGDNGSIGIQGTQGNKGEKGLKGESGERGLIGYKGSNGLIGVKGTKGETGQSYFSAFEAIYKYSEGDEAIQLSNSNNGIVHLYNENSLLFLQISSTTLQNDHFLNILDLKEKYDLIKLVSVTKPNNYIVFKILNIYSNAIQIQEVNKVGKLTINEQVVLSINLLGQHNSKLKGQKGESGTSDNSINAIKISNNVKTDIGRIQTIDFDFDNNILAFSILDNSIVHKIKCSGIKFES